VTLASSNPAPIASRFAGRFGTFGPKRVLPSSVDNLPAFTSVFSEIFAAWQDGNSADEQTLALMMMTVQLSRFKSTVKGDSKDSNKTSTASSRKSGICAEGAIFGAGEKSAEDHTGASLMNMMKRMYDEGDDQMKKVTLRPLIIPLFVTTVNSLSACRQLARPCSSLAWAAVLPLVAVLPPLMIQKIFRHNQSAEEYINIRRIPLLPSSVTWAVMHTIGLFKKLSCG
jgi:hypothetical protein